jgi:hypothetical protein
MRRGGTEKQSQLNKLKEKSMNAPTNNPSNTTHKTGFTPVPVEAHQKAMLNDQSKTVVMNGSTIVMRVIGGQWINFVVSSAK